MIKDAAELGFYANNLGKMIKLDNFEEPEKEITLKTEEKNDKITECFKNLIFYLEKQDFQ